MPISLDNDPQPANSRQYQQVSSSHSTFSSNSARSSYPQSGLKRVYNDIQIAAQTVASRAWSFYFGLSIPKRIILAILGMGFCGVAVMFLVFRERILELLVAFAEAWKSMKGGPYLMFFLITVISFPPLIGYSTLATLCGMMYGFPGGWPLLACGTLFGSTCSFLTFRYLLSGFATRLAQSNKKFAALAKTLENDSFVLLAMIRLCPLPYSLSNGALASIPTVSAKSFFLTTLATSPKLFIHVFVGDRLVKLGHEKDTATKIVDLISIALAGGFSVATAYTIYVRTIERAEGLDSASYENLELGSDGEDDLDLDIDSDNEELVEHELLTEGRNNR